MSSLPSYEVRVVSLPSEGQAVADLSDRLGRCLAHGIRPDAVALREDIWPGRAEFLGYPVVRLAMSSPVMWGVIA